MAALAVYEAFSWGPSPRAVALLMGALGFLSLMRGIRQRASEKQSSDAEIPPERRTVSEWVGLVLVCVAVVLGIYSFIY